MIKSRELFGCQRTSTADLNLYRLSHFDLGERTFQRLDIIHDDDFLRGDEADFFIILRTYEYTLLALGGQDKERPVVVLGEFSVVVLSVHPT